MLQYEFGDFDPCYLTIDNGATSVTRGRAPKPGIRMRFRSFDDFVDIGAGRVDPRIAVLRRRVRPSGRLRLLARLPKLFPA